MFARIIWGLLLVGLGGVMCYYSYWLVEQFGRNARAERNFGSTRNLILLLGFVVMIIGVMTMFGVISFSNPADQVPWGFGEEVAN